MDLAQNKKLLGNKRKNDSETSEDEKVKGIQFENIINDFFQ